MGRLDTIELGSRVMTIQTEFFSRPEWRLETKVYLAGAVKKVFTHDLEGIEDGDLQQTLDGFHDEKLRAIRASLQTLNR